MILQEMRIIFIMCKKLGILTLGDLQKYKESENIQDNYMLFKSLDFDTIGK